MTALILLIVGLGVVAAITGLVRQWWLSQQLRAGKIDEMPQIVEAAEAGCCGQHEVCEKDSLLAAVSKEIEYYDDEELDRFAGRESNNYDAAEVEEFEEVFTTLRSEEVAGWVRSLQLRGINIPDDIKDDVILVVGERRTQ